MLQQYLQVDLVPRWVLHPTSETNDTLSMLQPVVHYYRPPATTAPSFLLSVTSPSHSPCLCSLVSIQDPRGHVFHHIEDIQRFAGAQSSHLGVSHSFWQTMLYNATIVIETAKYPEGFAVIVVASPTDHLCQVQQSANRCPPANCSLPAKQVVMRLVENSTYWHYLYVTLGTAGVYVFLFVVTIIISWIEFRYEDHELEDIEKLKKEMQTKKSNELVDETVKMINLVQKSIAPSSDTQVSDEEEETKLLDVSKKMIRHQRVLKQLSSKEGKRATKTATIEMDDLISANLFINLDELDKMGVEVKDRNKGRLKRDLRLSDLSEKLGDLSKSRSMYEKSEMYWQCLVIISIYYSIPTIQMVLDTNSEFDSTGNQDLCYFNTQCTKPLGRLKDFGSTFSNLGYVVLGLLFIFLVRLKSTRFDQIEITHLHGVPQQNGVLYALGAALVMEGLMSTIYHVCPTTLAFQFDTTFMYLIAILMFVKLFQGRHPDLSPNAFVAYMILGIALILEAFSFYYNGLPFWIVFCTIYMSFVVVISVVSYSLGTVKNDRYILWSVVKVVFAELKGTARTSAGGSQCQAPVFRARWGPFSNLFKLLSPQDCSTICDG